MNTDAVRLLLLALSEGTSSFRVYKHVDHALAGLGDADCFIAREDLDAARATIVDVARSHDWLVWQLDYRRFARTFLVAERSQESSAELLAEIDLNTSPSVRLLKWFGICEDDVEFREGVRVAGWETERIASLMYYRLGGDFSGAPPNREVALFTDLPREQVSRLAARLDGLPWPACKALVALLAEMSANPAAKVAPAQRRLITLVEAVRHPVEAIGEMNWRRSPQQIGRSDYGRRFVEECRRDISALGGLAQFEQLLADAGGVRIA